jgi:pimeloyl-ACP methyl ester carboxylesterase
MPLVCLPGLTRNSADFEPVFEQFGKTRQIIAMDFRGRGKSAAADPASYRPDMELQDTLGFLDHLNINRFALLGTSRGGIVGLLMAATANARMAGLCLNDIGCKLEADGLLRIKSYVGSPRRYAGWDEAAAAISASSAGFDNVSPASWNRVARRIFKETPEGITHNHDLSLADNLPSEADVKAGKIAELWPLLAACNAMPFALLRGEGSDLLSQDTVLRMQAASPHLKATIVQHRGHVPFLDEPESVAALAAWLADIPDQDAALTQIP